VATARRYEERCPAGRRSRLQAAKAALATPCLDVRVSDSPVWDVERMRPVVLEWDAALRAEMPAHARLVPEAEARGSILRAPATAKDVAAAEVRLGVRLPQSYRSFLLISNGAEAGADRVSRVERLLPCVREELLGVQDVGRFADVEHLAWLVEMWRETMAESAGRQEVPPADRPVDVCDFEPGSRAVSITRPVQDGIVGLVPFAGEWQVWEFFHEHVGAHPSFAAFLQHHAREARRRVADRAERVQAARADGSSVSDVWDLVDDGDPRAVDAACRALLSPQHSPDMKSGVAIRLMLLGRPEAIPPLRAALARINDPESSTVPGGLPPRTVQIMRSNLENAILRALDACGDPQIVDELKRRADASPEGFAAQWLAARDDLPRW
jgi:hypothetical protein